MNIRRHAGLFIILVIHALFTGSVRADSWQQDGSVGVTAEYDTNPTLIPDFRGGVWQSVLAPSYTLKRVGDRNELKAGISAQISRSSNLFLLQNRNNPSAFLDWNRQGDVGKFDISAKYDENSTLLSQVDISGPRLTDSTIATRTISGSWERSLSERSTLSTDGSYQHITYSGADYTDYATRSGNMMYKYEWSEQIKPYVKIHYADYEPVNSNSIFPPSHFTETALGLNWEATEYLAGLLQAGKANVSGGKVINTQGLSVQYTGQRMALVLNESRQISATGLGGFVIVDQANGNWSYPLNETNKIGIDLVRQKNHDIQEVINGTTGAWLQHDINSFWGARTYYLHRNIYQAGVGRAYSDTLGVALTYANPNF